VEPNPSKLLLGTATLALQRIGTEVFDFLYENREIGTRVEVIDLRLESPSVCAVSTLFSRK
jgi:hypothetical protein